MLVISPLGQVIESMKGPVVVMLFILYTRLTPHSADTNCGARSYMNVAVSRASLTKPVLKLSQKSADQIHLTWKKVPGAKGYQIYCKTD